MLVSELKKIIEEIDENAELDGIFVLEDRVQFEEEGEDRRRFVCNIISTKGSSTTKTSFKYIGAYRSKKIKTDLPKQTAFSRLFQSN